MTETSEGASTPQLPDAVPRTDRNSQSVLGSGFVDFFAVPDLDDENDVWGLDGVDNAPIFHTQPPCSPEAVPQGLAELDGVRGELVLNGPADGRNSATRGYAWVRFRTLL